MFNQNCYFRRLICIIVEDYLYQTCSLLLYKPQTSDRIVCINFILIDIIGNSRIDCVIFINNYCYYQVIDDDDDDNDDVNDNYTINDNKYMFMFEV
jgi:hypothetical protein